MSTGESLIILLLIIIAYFLYQIAKQLTYITGKRMKLSLFGKSYTAYFKPKVKPLPKVEKEEKLTN
jgi:hypothetical protein